MSTSKLIDAGISISEESRSSDALAAFFLASEPEQIEPLSLFVDLNEYADKLTKKARIIYAMRQNEIVGICAYYHNLAPKYSYIPLILVRKSIRGIGLGKLLINKVIQSCLDSRGIELEVSEINEVAIRFYSGLGFEVYDRKSTENVASIHYIMRLNINA